MATTIAAIVRTIEISVSYMNLNVLICKSIGFVGFSLSFFLYLSLSTDKFKKLLLPVQYVERRLIDELTKSIFTLFVSSFSFK